MSTAAVIDYYDQCHVDYKILWRSHRNLCIHFGYFDAEHSSHGMALSNMNRVLAARVGVTGEDSVLDAGCGVGGSAMWLAEHCGARVCGVNIQPRHLELARREAKERGLDHLIRFEERNYCDTGFADESFDVVWALESVCHCVDKLAFIGEAYRVLEPGGRIMVADFFQFQAGLGGDQQRRMRLWLDGWSLPNLAHMEEFRDGLESAGFTEVCCDDITSNVVRSSRRIWKASLIMLPLSRPLEVLGVRSQRQTANVVASYHQYTTMCDGLWGYAVFTASKPVN